MRYYVVLEKILFPLLLLQIFLCLIIKKTPKVNVSGPSPFCFIFSTSLDSYRMMKEKKG